MEVVSLTYKVLSGQADASEREQLEEWIAQSEANRREFEDIKLLWENSISNAHGSQTHDSGFEKVRSRLKERLARKRWMYALSWSFTVFIIALMLWLILRGTSA